MKRVQWLELEDIPALPAVIRDGGTDLLDLGFATMGFYNGVVPHLAALLTERRATDVVDLCSGAGGGTLLLREALRNAGQSPTFTFTDRFPNAAGIAKVAALGDPKTRYLPDPVDAMDGGGDRPGVRTMSSALHHFPPEAIAQLVGGIVARGEPLAFFDVAGDANLRKMPALFAPVAMIFNFSVLFLVALLTTPLVRPFRLSRLLLTYPLPLIPFLFGWDGTVSALRAYLPEDLLAIAQSVPGAETYTWSAGVAGKALYLTGVPTHR